MWTHLESGPVVAGIDGSETALRAVKWSAAQARRLGVGLRLVHAFEFPLRHPAGAVDEQSAREFLRARGLRWLETARRVAVDAIPDLSVALVSVESSAAQLLITESATALQIVLGSRGLGGFSGLLIGSTATRVTGRALCPTVVVCGSGAVRTTGPVVVGVDGTVVSDAAVEFAFAQAALCGAELTAVHSWTEPAMRGALSAGTVAMDYRLLANDAEKILAERLAGWREKYPDVRVTGSILHDSPTRALVAQSTTAQLVVVGCRGRGAFRSLVLGSTSQQLLHHSYCPVAVVGPHQG
jgi:nucleotide-binding universal stress UspA family protein